MTTAQCLDICCIHFTSLFGYISWFQAGICCHWFFYETTLAELTILALSFFNMNVTEASITYIFTFVNKTSNIITTTTTTTTYIVLTKGWLVTITSLCKVVVIYTKNLNRRFLEIFYLKSQAYYSNITSSIHENRFDYLS